MKTKTKKIISLTLIMGLFLILSGIVSAEEKKQNEEVITKQATGVISGLSANFIAIETGLNTDKTAANEQAFNFDKNAKIEHKNSLKEIKVGDTVTVEYDETISLRDDGIKLRTTKVKKIIFLKPAPKELTAQEETIFTPKGETEKVPLSLKGLKER